MPSSRVPADWPQLPDEALLDLRLADLPLRIEDTVLEARIGKLAAELEARDLRLPIHYYISTEWFTPEDDEDDGDAAVEWYGPVKVEPEGERYVIHLPPSSVTDESGTRIEIGTIRLDVEPMADGAYKVAALLPNAVSALRFMAALPVRLSASAS